MNYFWPSIRKHVLSTIAFSRGFEVALTPYGNPLETLWNPLENLWKPCGNPFETLWNPFETLWNPLETLLKRFETLWNMETLNPLEMFRILFENAIWKCQGKKGILVCVRWRMRDSAACYNFFFCRHVILPHDSVLIYTCGKIKRYNACETSTKFNGENFGRLQM